MVDPDGSAPDAPASGQPNKALVLLRLAVRGVFSWAGGKAAASLAFGPIGAVAGNVVEHWGPRIVEKWLPWFRSAPRAEACAAMEELANLPMAESRARAAELVEAEAPAEAGPEEKRLAADYLAAMPGALRASMVPDPRSGRSTCPGDLVPASEAAVYRLLPAVVPPFPVPHELAGTPYTLVDLLGTGGFGVVYKALNRHEQDGDPRAIKFCLDAQMAASLHRERKILDALKEGGRKWSDKIVRLYGHNLEADPPYLIYECVEGGDLSAYLTRRRRQAGGGLSVEEAASVVRKIAEALAVAHGHGLVHRDLKPSNVLVDGDALKLADFGIGAKRDGAASSPTARNPLSLQQSQLLARSGTGLYMSKEQSRGDAPDPRHDLYSLGVLWYQLLVGDTAQPMTPGWDSELRLKFKVAPETIELIGRCVGWFDQRPADGAALLRLLPRRDVPPLVDLDALLRQKTEAEAARRRADDAARAAQAAREAAAREEELRRLQLLLPQQIARDDYAAAEYTANAILKLKPDDPDAIKAKAFLRERRSAPRVTKPAATAGADASKPTANKKSSQGGCGMMIFMAILPGGLAYGIAHDLLKLQKESVDHWVAVGLFIGIILALAAGGEKKP